MDKNELQSLFIEIVEKVYTKLFKRLMPENVCNEAMEDISDYVLQYAYQLNGDSYKISSKDFKSFINAPQIKDMINDCLESLILSCLVEKDDRKIIIADNSINYCLEVIEKNYTLLSDDDSIGLIKNYLELILQTNQIMKKISLNVKIDGDLKIFLQELAHREDFKSVIYDDTVRQVEDLLSIDFVCDNKKIESAKNIYQKALKQIYQLGFIYFIGEFKFNEFYIAPILTSVMYC